MKAKDFVEVVMTDVNNDYEQAIDALYDEDYLKGVGVDDMNILYEAHDIILKRMNSDNRCLKRISQKIAWIEVLDEMALVAAEAGSKISFCVYVTPDNHRIGEEYFKVYNAFSQEKADEICRISFHEPRYIVHRNVRDVGKDAKRLNSKQKKALVALLKSKKMFYENKEVTVWQKAILEYNNCRGLDYGLTFKNKIFDENGNQIPKENRAYPDYLPIDLPMPDYMKLPDIKD